jgi:hypothetical protein
MVTAIRNEGARANAIGAIAIDSYRGSDVDTLREYRIHSGHR